MNIISGAEIRAKSKSGMTSEQITKELLNSPTEEVKPSQVAQLMKENAELKAENEKLKNKTLDNPQKSFDAMCKVVVELQEQIKKLKKQLVDNDDEISCHCEQIEKLEEELNR